MPNWCDNTLIIEGDQKVIDKLIEQAQQPIPQNFSTLNKDGSRTTEVRVEPSLFSFMNFIRPPQEAIDSGEYFGTRGFDGEHKLGFTHNNWYEFNTREWGTKWDASEVTIDVFSEGDTAIHFATAWSPAIPVIKEIIKQYPDLTFEYDYEEPGMSFAGRITYSPENGLSENEWDIDYEEMMG
jgi:hypothetical protein